MDDAAPEDAEGGRAAKRKSGVKVNGGRAGRQALKADQSHRAFGKPEHDDRSIAEHDNASLKDATQHAVAGCQKIGGDIQHPGGGAKCDSGAAELPSLPASPKVLVADDALYEHSLAENRWPRWIVCWPGLRRHRARPTVTTGKNIMPRVAALLDVRADLAKLRGRERRHLVRRSMPATPWRPCSRSGTGKVITIRATRLRRGGGRADRAAIEKVAAPAIRAFRRSSGTNFGRRASGRS